MPFTRFCDKSLKKNLPVSQTDLHVQSRFQKELQLPVYGKSHNWNLNSKHINTNCKQFLWNTVNVQGYHSHTPNTDSVHHYQHLMLNHQKAHMQHFLMIGWLPKVYQNHQSYALFTYSERSFLTSKDLSRRVLQSTLATSSKRKCPRTVLYLI